MQNRIASVYLLLSTDSYYDHTSARPDSEQNRFCLLTANHELLTTVNVCVAVLLLIPLPLVVLLTIVNVYCFLDLLITVNVMGFTLLYHRPESVVTLPVYIPSPDSDAFIIR